MTTETPNTVMDCIDWPLTCIYCGSEQVIWSTTKQNVLCEECGRWQLEDEDE